VTRDYTDPESQFPSSSNLANAFWYLDLVAHSVNSSDPARTGARRHRCIKSNPGVAGCSAGFTLLEIAVVLFLMGLIMVIALPYIGGYTNGQLKSASRRMAGRATYLFDEASARKLVIQLVFDMDNSLYFVMVADPYAPQPTFFPDLSPSGARVKLPDQVRIRDVTVEGIGTLSRGTVATQFYPEGYVDATLIHLIDNKGRIMTLRIDPLTGRVNIANGDLRLGRAG
jgi:prepilin-type N-terminal cleavage/methylation domain-containing protein